MLSFIIISYINHAASYNKKTCGYASSILASTTSCVSTSHESESGSSTSSHTTSYLCSKYASARAKWYSYAACLFCIHSTSSYSRLYASIPTYVRSQSTHPSADASLLQPVHATSPREPLQKCASSDVVESQLRLLGCQFFDRHDYR